MSAAVKATLVLLLLYGLSVAVGILYAMTGFVQSDTCWLVKLGLLMLETHRIPSSDPLSFTLALAAKNGSPQPYVLYQWLSELVLALSFKTFNLAGLIAVCAFTTALASTSLLFRLCLRKSGHLLISALLVSLATASVSMRLMVRPEVFSILLTVALFYLWEHFNEKNRAQLHLLSLAPLVLLMIVWCNLHSGFVIGLCFLAVQVAIRFAVSVTNKQPPDQLLRNSAVALLATTGASLVNPFGIGLWFYLPRLFFSPINVGISETQAVSFRELGLPIYYPFFLLIGFSAYTVIRFANDKKEASGGQELARPERLAAIVTIAVAVVSSLLCKRLASPMSLFIAYETACLLSGTAPLADKISFLQRKVSIFILEVPVVCMALLAVSITCSRLAPLTMPQASMKFTPPFQATQFLTNNWTGGNIFNSAQIGSMLDLYGKPEMKVFIDTRLDAFGEKILADYVDMIDVRARAKSLFDFYEIKWAILTPHDRVAAVLNLAPGWSKVFEDKDGIVFKRAP